MAAGSGGSRRCLREGCRAWAMRGGLFCRAHRERSNKPDDIDEPTELNVRDEPSARVTRTTAFAGQVREGRLDAAIEEAVRAAIAACGADLSLGAEIGALRLVLQRVVAVDALESDPKELAVTMTRLVDSITRTIRLQRTLSGGRADAIADAVTTVLLELGLGGDA